MYLSTQLIDHNIVLSFQKVIKTFYFFISFSFSCYIYLVRTIMPVTQNLKITFRLFVFLTIPTTNNSGITYTLHLRTPTQAQKPVLWRTPFLLCRIINDENRTFCFLWKQKGYYDCHYSMTSKTRAGVILQLALQKHKSHISEKHIARDICEQVIDDAEKSLYCVICKRQFNYHSWYRRHMVMWIAVQHAISKIRHRKREFMCMSCNYNKINLVILNCFRTIIPVTQNLKITFCLFVFLTIPITNNSWMLDYTT